ncbi:MAG TPA: PP2C family serine/threonine-protein phosphatase [Burkholderiaceae bacterium]|nr:PP2C family serine/threonine-protein phosphatase [Burkholderiaceae bacterium]
MMLYVSASQRSCMGTRNQNEDCLGVDRIGQHWCLVLSDGAGGHRDGALASRIVVDRVLAGFRSRPPVDGPDLRELILDAHDGVIAAQRARGATDRASAMHATVVVLLIDADNSKALWGHVGDSRLYIVRDQHAWTLTRDDSVLHWMIDAGYWQSGDVKDYPHRNQLMAALGADEGINPHISAEPFSLREGDAFLLCSDGWWSSVTDDEIELLQAGATTPDEWLDAMITRTAKRADPRQDNFSAIGCWVGGKTS